MKKSGAVTIIQKIDARQRKPILLLEAAMHHIAHNKPVAAHLHLHG